MSTSKETYGQHCLVHVRVRANTGFGQIVAIGGSPNALGRFRLNEVTELVTTPESYPIWYTEKPLVLPLNCEVQYKYGIVEGGYCRNFESGKYRSFTPTLSDCVLEDIVDNLTTSKSSSNTYPYCVSNSGSILVKTSLAVATGSFVNVIYQRRHDTRHWSLQLSNIMASNE